MGEQLACNGLVNVWYRLPKLMSVLKQICYQFSGQGEVCIEGDNYQITSENIYQVSWSWYSGDNQQIPGGGNSATVKADSYNTTSAESQGEIYVNFVYLGVTYSIVYYNPNNDPIPTVNFCSDPIVLTSSCSRGSNGGTKVYAATFSISLTETRYTVNIKNSSNQIIHTASGNSNPSVRIIEASQTCTLDTSSWEFGGNFNGNNSTVEQKQYTDILGRKSIKLIQYYGLLGIERLNKNSPAGCDIYPEIKTIGCQKKEDCNGYRNTFSGCCRGDTAYVEINGKIYPISLKGNLITDLLASTNKCVIIEVKDSEVKIYVEFSPLPVLPIPGKFGKSRILRLTLSICPIKSVSISCSPLNKKPECPDGYIWSDTLQKCIYNEIPKPKKKCPEGYYYDETTDLCKPQKKCPEGYQWDNDSKSCKKARECPPNTDYECKDNGVVCCYQCRRGQYYLIDSFTK
jgi:hypothetical protein